MFNVLRRLPQLVCFNEPFNDQFGLELTKSSIAHHKEPWDTNHEFLDRPAHYEYIAAWDHVMPRYQHGAGVRGFLPVGGVLSDEQRAYLASFIDYAASIGKRLALCEVQSLGRVGAIRDAFDGYHVAQFRDPLSQWGAIFRQVEGYQAWSLLALCLLQISQNRDQPLYRLIPDADILPSLLWPASDRWERWGTIVEHVKLIKSEDPAALARAFRWHVLAWMLNNTAAVAYADLSLDIDALHDDPQYLRGITSTLGAEIGTVPDFSDVQKFSRFYSYEGFDVAQTCRSLMLDYEAALADGKLEAAIGALASRPPLRPVVDAAHLIVEKLDRSLREFAAASDRRHVSNEAWAKLVRSSRLRWESRHFRHFARRLDGFAVPLASAARRAGLWR